MLKDAYKVIPGLFASPEQEARSPRFERLESAVSAMATGVVIDHTGRVVAFHESHLRLIEAHVGNYDTEAMASRHEV